MSCETKDKLRKDAVDNFRRVILDYQETLANTESIGLIEFHKKFMNAELKLKYFQDKLNFILF